MAAAAKRGRWRNEAYARRISAAIVALAAAYQRVSNRPRVV